MSLETIILGGLGVGIASGVLGIWVATQKRRSPLEGWWAGFLLGPFGVLLVALFPAGEAPTKKAPVRLSRSDCRAVKDEVREDEEAAKWLRNAGRN